MRIPHKMEDLARNLSSAEADLKLRLDQLEANATATKAELKEVQQKLTSLVEDGTRPEEEASAGTGPSQEASAGTRPSQEASAGTDSHEQFEDQMRAMRSNLSDCASDVSQLWRQITNHSSLLQELVSGHGKVTTTEEMESVISRYINIRNI